MPKRASTCPLKTGYFGHHNQRLLESCFTYATDDEYFSRETVAVPAP